MMTQAIQIERTEEVRVQTNGIETVYDTIGNPNDPPLLLVSGMGSQLVAWDLDFCERLAAHGLWLIRYDNRDVGLATKFTEAGVPNTLAMMMGQQVTVPYLLRDMAADGMGVLDALGVAQAHVLGVSMGGMIVQEMLINWPERVKTAVSIMSNPAFPPPVMPTPAAMAAMSSPSPVEREAYLDHSVQSWYAYIGKGFPMDEARVRRSAAAQYDRCFHPEGPGRQMAAVIASGDRSEKLRHVTTPTLVIHGDDDPLVNVQGGIATAAAIPNAELMIVPGMGHSLPVETWPEIMSRIAQHVGR
jgi:pimeloyl-ACP methyl ester carboxylesterase